MQPEDIDQLFRDRLQGHAPTPPAFIWNEIEAEIQPRRKRPVLWLAAAAVTLLTLLGGAWWVLSGSNPGQLGQQPTLATSSPRVTNPENQKQQNNSTSQATAPLVSSSSPTEAQANEPAAVVATTEPSLQARSAGVQPDPAPAKSRLNQPRTSSPRNVALASATPPQPIPTPTTPSLPEPEADPELARPTQLPTTATVALNGPIEVEVRSAAQPAAVATTETGRRPRLTSLLRQARNVVQGERVSLTEAGLPESVTVQARVGSHTLTKVIQL